MGEANIAEEMHQTRALLNAASYLRALLMDFRLELPATDKTPAVIFDPGQGALSIVGCSIPENAERFFGPIQDMAERYAQQPAPRTTLRVELTYFNSSTSKYLLDLMKCLADLHASARSSVIVEWCYSKDDLDMKEAGEDYRSLVDLPVKLKVLDH